MKSDGYRIKFNNLEWESPIFGMRQKVFTDGARRVRLVEYSADMEPHWCERGHHGYILEGRFELEFDSGTVVYEPGDGVFIPDGAEHRHRGTVLTDVVRVVFVEDI
jgi:quercetin dioxygenase-like cupin family protein